MCAHIIMCVPVVDGGVAIYDRAKARSDLQ